MNETMTTIVGNVITDVKQRRIADGTRVASFRVASNERRYDKATEQWVAGDSLFVSVTCWRKLALGVSASLMKGDPVIITGRIFTRGYEVEGQKRSVTELEAVAVGPDLSRCFAEVSRARREATEDVPGDGAPDESVGDGTTESDATGTVRLAAVPSQPVRRASESAEMAVAGSP
ncbi:MAG: single-stranded DNA-binding protein [Actinomycetota bacterium]|nr:single-stranded DNA-binding protein [Actinomycetota bacterium]